jgi:hypothetical protein
LAAAGLATAVALLSIWHGAAPTWRQLNDGHREYAAYSDQDRRHAAAAHAGFMGAFFDQLDSYVDGDDRVYYQVSHRPYGTLDLHDTVAALGRYYLAPAVEVTDPADATVVVSYEADPAEVNLNWVLQRRLGPGIYVSRAYYP